MDAAAFLVLATTMAFAFSALIYAFGPLEDGHSLGLRGVITTLALTSVGHFALYSLVWVAWRSP